jgi:hypothetical protein
MMKQLMAYPVLQVSREKEALVEYRSSHSRAPGALFLLLLIPSFTKKYSLRTRL